MAVKYHQVGQIGVADLATMAADLGLERLPYPLNATWPPGQSPAPVARQPVLDADDKAAFSSWVERYMRADIWVTARVFHTAADAPAERIVCFRTADIGYLAVQHTDTVEVRRLHAHDLAAAIGDELPLTSAGEYREAIVPRYVGYFAGLNPTAPAQYEEAEEPLWSTRSALPPRPRYQVIPDHDVTTVTVIQSHWKQPHNWGVDWGKNAVVTVAANNDGDYVYRPDYTYATPVDHSVLTMRINTLIAEDVSRIRDAY